VETYRLAIAISFTVAIVSIFILPIPYGVYASIGVWVAFAVWLRYRYAVQNGEVKVRYACIACETVTNNKSCPKCGGHAFKTI